MGVLLPACVHKIKPIAAKMFGTMMCQRRSRVLSECRPTNIMQISAQVYGTVVSIPM